MNPIQRRKKQVTMLGWPLCLCRMGASLVFPVIIGMLTRLLWVRLQ